MSAVLFFSDQTEFIDWLDVHHQIASEICSDSQKLDFLQSRFFYSVFLRSETHLLSKLNWTLPA